MLYYKMPNYQNTVIYRIALKSDETECYIGSTCNFKHRMENHKYDCKTESRPNYNGQLYTFIREKGGWDNFEFDIIEEYPCLNKEELYIRERYWIELVSTLNSDIPGRTFKEWYNDNIDDQKEKRKVYNKKNAEYISNRYKLYCEKNAEKLDGRCRKYYRENRGEILEKIKKKFTCICGQVSTIAHKARHERNQIHQKYLNTLK